MKRSRSLSLLATGVLIFARALLTAPLAAQTTATPTAHRAPATAPHPAPAKAVPCAKLPELSPKIPALPPGLPCAKPLYTISVVPTLKLEYVSPLEGPDLAEALGINPTFSLDYIDTQIGAGELAAPHKWYTINYTGYLVDGKKFDSSVDQGAPITIEYGTHHVIPGWDTGFNGMRVGGKRRLFIPYQLAYGAAGSPPTIPARSELIFDVELVSQSDTEPAPKTPPAPANPPAAQTSPANQPAPIPQSTPPPPAPVTAAPPKP